MLRSQPNVALFSTTRTAQREGQFFWVGPLYTVHFGFYARKDRDLQLGSLDDAKKVGSIATYKDDVREQLLKKMGFTNLDSSKSPASNLKKLMSGRVDLWLFDNLGMEELARQENVAPAELVLALPFKSYQSYVAISRDTSPAVVQKWQSALQAMVADGTFHHISRQWLPDESIPDFDNTQYSVHGTAPVRLYTEDSPPASYRVDDKLTGFAVEVVREILKSLKQPDTIGVVSWSRGYTLARQMPYTALFSTTRMAQREKLFQWVGPLYAHTWAFYSRKGAGIRIRSLKEAKSIKRIGTYLRDAKMQFLKRQGFQNLVVANRNSSNIQHLLRGEIDLWVSSDFNMPYLMRQAGFDPNAVEMVYAFRKVANYIAFSLKTPPAVVRTWQQSLDRLKVDGTFQRIAQKYQIEPHMLR
jgi:polar amino acid transport system substrate-binding protein